MGEYIDKQELYNTEKLLDTDVIRESKTASWLIDQVLHDIKESRAADVAPVVRCIECEYSRKPAVLTQIYGEPNTRTCTHGPCNRRNVSGDFFCGEGKRRANNE